MEEFQHFLISRSGAIAYRISVSSIRVLDYYSILHAGASDRIRQIHRNTCFHFYFSVCLS